MRSKILEDINQDYYQEKFVAWHLRNNHYLNTVEANLHNLYPNT